MIATDKNITVTLTQAMTLDGRAYAIGDTYQIPDWYIMLWMQRNGFAKPKAKPGRRQSPGC